MSFAHEIAVDWSHIERPIHAYYLGDFDPSGFDLERDLRAKLTRYSKAEFTWHRLGVLASDFDEFNLIKLKTKATDKRTPRFIKVHGTYCAEVDAIPATELRRRVRDAIESHVDQEAWERLQHVEQIEKESFQDALGKFQSNHLMNQDDE